MFIRMFPIDEISLRKTLKVSTVLRNEQQKSVRAMLRDKVADSRKSIPPQIIVFVPLQRR